MITKKKKNFFNSIFFFRSEFIFCRHLKLPQIEMNLHFSIVRMTSGDTKVSELWLRDMEIFILLVGKQNFSLFIITRHGKQKKKKLLEHAGERNTNGKSCRLLNRHHASHSP